ncbi:MAG: hypothetical protein P8Z79_12985 [Sedimentisphaerales bacterium]
MNIFFAQIGPALRAEDTEHWTDILAVVVFAVIWLIGGIIKAATKKPEAGRKQPSPTPRQPTPIRMRQPTAGRPKYPADFARVRAEHRPVRPATPQRRSRLEKLAAEFEKVLGPYMPESPPQPASPSPRPQAQPAMQQPPDVATLRPVPPKEIPKLERPPEIILGYADADELTKAILYYEILGPPVSLRGPSHQAVAP